MKKKENDEGKNSRFEVIVLGVSMHLSGEKILFSFLSADARLFGERASVLSLLLLRCKSVIVPCYAVCVFRYGITWCCNMA